MLQFHRIMLNMSLLALWVRCFSPGQLVNEITKQSLKVLQLVIMQPREWLKKIQVSFHKYSRKEHCSVHLNFKETCITTKIPLLSSEITTVHEKSLQKQRLNLPYSYSFLEMEDVSSCQVACHCLSQKVVSSSNVFMVSKSSFFRIKSTPTTATNNRVLQKKLPI